MCECGCVCVWCVCYVCMTSCRHNSLINALIVIYLTGAGGYVGRMILGASLQSQRQRLGHNDPSSVVCVYKVCVCGGCVYKVCGGVYVCVWCVCVYSVCVVCVPVCVCVCGVVLCVYVCVVCVWCV